MKSDEGIFKMLSKSSIIRNQYENVRLISVIKKFKNAREIKHSGVFFVLSFYDYPKIIAKYKKQEEK